MTESADTWPRAYMTLDEQVNAAPIAATQEMPGDLADMLTQHSGPFVSSAPKPRMDFATERVPGVPDMWRVVGSRGDEEIRTTIAGDEMGAVTPEEIRRLRVDQVPITEGFRPPWAPLEYVPPLTPFRKGDHIFLEPRAHEEPNRLSYPARCFGYVRTNIEEGSGVLVGPNLMLTASHVAPWNTSPWFMEFVPALRQGGSPARPFGSSYVQKVWGIPNTSTTEVTGYDYVICKLYNPLGNALGWLGSIWWSDEDEYYRRRYNSSGYPFAYGQRPAVELDMGIRDIDGDDPGLEIEFALRGDLGSGWSGGPLWLPREANDTKVVGVLSGYETDVFDPTRHVFAGGRHMVDLVKYGLANWPA